MNGCGKHETKKSGKKEISDKDLCETEKHSHGKSHFWMMFVCIALIAAVFIASYFFDFKGSYVTWILLAACIGMHFFMMKGHGH